MAVDSVTAISTKSEMSVNETCRINIEAKSGEAPAPGVKITFKFLTGQGRVERGTFSPAEPVTDANGRAAADFTALHNGMAKIEVAAEGATCEVDILIKP